VGSLSGAPLTLDLTMFLVNCALGRIAKNQPKYPVITNFFDCFGVII
jgi:hypothetical protein